MSKKTEKVLVLRTCNANMSSAHDSSFVYPKSGPVEAKDWDPDETRACGGGLHGLLWGAGDWSLLSNAHDAVWMLVAVAPSDGLVPSEGKVRFRKGEVVYAGDQAGAMTRIMCSPEAMTRSQKEARAWAKENKTVTCEGSKATAGSAAHAATAGERAHAATAGERAHAATAGNDAHAATAGNDAHAATAGLYGKAETEGKKCIAASLGTGGKARAGEDGLVIVTWWDKDAQRYRACVGEVGIDGIKANVFYAVENGKLKETT
ncbi:MAG: hypothetical protein IT381_21235 [Deltaproteobacteria bacterium]|nr:hypothetical protein [Deltaproteobacteria bacterium]